MAEKMSPDEVSYLMRALKDVEMFTCLTVSEMDQIVDQMHKVRIPKGKVIFKEGDEGTAMFIVYKGKVEVHIKKWFGRKGVVSVLKPGEIFGEMALATFQPRMATATALEPCECFILFKASFQFAIQNNPVFIVHLRELMERRGLQNRNM